MRLSNENSHYKGFKQKILESAKDDLVSVFAIH